MPRRNTRFTGREDCWARCTSSSSGAEPGAGVVTLLGMSGVGKTQIATEYVYRFGSEYDVVWWVRAGEARHAAPSSWPNSPRHWAWLTGREYGERLRAVRDALRRGDPYGRWLLVLDGADEPDQIADLVPTGPGHVLITSRNREWARAQQQSCSRCRSTTGSSRSPSSPPRARLDGIEADQLAEALEDLPLLLDQTRGLAERLDHSRWTEYIELLRTAASTGRLKVAGGLPVAFQTAWSILLNRLRETAPSRSTCCGCASSSHPGSIPVRLLRDMPPSELPEQLAGLLKRPAAVEQGDQQARPVVRGPAGSQETAADELRVPAGSRSRCTAWSTRSCGRTCRSEEQEYSRVVRQVLAAADPGRPTDPGVAAVRRDRAASGGVGRAGEHRTRRSSGMVLNCLRYIYFSGEYRAGLQDRASVAMRPGRGLLGGPIPGSWDLTHHQANLLRAVGDYARHRGAGPRRLRAAARPSAATATC